MRGSDKTGKKQDTRFKPGRSGNPEGRPRGSRNATTLALEALLGGEAETLTRKAIELAKGGDLAALRLCIDRLGSTSQGSSGVVRPSEDRKCQGRCERYICGAYRSLDRRSDARRGQRRDSASGRLGYGV